MSVNSASISTIHSFCYELIKQNFKELSLSPSVRIGDDTEMKVLLSQVCEDVIDRWYEEHGDEFKEICDVFVSVSIGKLGRITHTRQDLAQRSKRNTRAFGKLIVG